MKEGVVLLFDSSVLPKIHPVRFLESQMAALRMAFTAWLDGEPEELGGDRPTEEQMQQYEQAEREHEALVSYGLP